MKLLTCEPVKTETRDFRVKASSRESLLGQRAGKSCFSNRVAPSSVGWDQELTHHVAEGQTAKCEYLGAGGSKGFPPQTAVEASVSSLPSSLKQPKEREEGDQAARVWGNP